MRHIDADVGFLSPYGRNFKRFGDYRLDLKKPPEAWLKETLFRQAVRKSRKDAPRGAQAQPT